METLVPQAITAADLHAILVLNNAHAAELSWLDPSGLEALLKEAFYARRIGRLAAFIVAFDQGAAYRSPNYLWFRARREHFVYVDRIVVAPEARGRGLARILYQDLFAHTRAEGHGTVCCEVNADPPNPASDAFHASLGFTAVGEALLSDGMKTVRYFERALHP